MSSESCPNPNLSKATYSGDFNQSLWSLGKHRISPKNIIPEMA